MKHADLIARMSIQEKAAFVSGKGFWHTKAIPRLDIPAVMLTDGPHGLRKQPGDGAVVDFSNPVHTTAFPTAALTACSFDPALLEEMGRALGRECRAENVAMILGPGANIKRSPLCGRNFVYFSEDPLLSSRLAAALIQGVEGQGVATSLKHFAVNNQETRRMSIDAVPEPRALREIYLASFEEAVKEGKPSSVMCAYNRLNGEYCSENHWLLTKVLRDEWGYQGLVVSDWGAVNDRPKGIEAGLDLEMPENLAGSTDAILAALASGALQEAALDACVSRVLDFVLRARDQGLSLPAAAAPAPFDAEAHHELARRIARESMVLLKNQGKLLPFDPSQEITVLGELAFTPRYQGAGSSLLVPTRIESLCDAMTSREIKHQFAPAYRIDQDRTDRKLLDQALEMAARASNLLVVVGLTDYYESEGFDRTHLRLPANQIALLDALTKLNKRFALVLMGGAPVELPWLSKIDALLNGYLGGQACGAAQADLLFGDHSPGGKLAESWPLALEDCPSQGNFPGSAQQVLYKEGIFVGYRYFDTAGVPVAFPFGHGLSYTSFNCKDLVLSTATPDARALRDGKQLEISLTLTNTGNRAGSEVIQVYLSKLDSALERPGHELRAFAKVRLEPKASQVVSLALPYRAFAHWDEASQAFLVENGAWTVSAGTGLDNLPLSADIVMQGGVLPAPTPRRDLAQAFGLITDRDFANRRGIPIPDLPPLMPFHRNSLMADMSRESVLIRLFLAVAIRLFTKATGVEKKNPNYRMMADMMASTPVAKFTALSGGQFSPRMVDGLLDIANGRRIRGLGKILKRA